MATFTYDPILGIITNDSGGGGNTAVTDPGNGLPSIGSVSPLVTADTAQSVLFGPTQIIDAIGPTTPGGINPSIGLPAGFIADFTLQGALYALSFSSGYSLSLLKPGDIWHFQPGSSVYVGRRATLLVDTQLENLSNINLAGGNLTYGVTPLAFGTVTFFSGNSTLQLNSGAVVTGTLVDFSSTDQIVFNGLTGATPTLTGTTLAVTGTAPGGGTVTETFSLRRTDGLVYTQGAFTLTPTSTGEILTVAGLARPPVPVISVGQAPVISNPAAPSSVGLGLTVSDAGSATLISATVAVTNYYKTIR